MVKTGLLILTNPTKIANLLPSVLKYVNNTLYIHWNPHNKIVEVQPTEWPSHIQTVHQIYYQASIHCQNLDVRVLLPAIKNPTALLVDTYRQIEVLLFDKNYNENELQSWKDKFKNIHVKCSTVTLQPTHTFATTSKSTTTCGQNDHTNTNKVYDYVVLGGTFDRLHDGHKILLNEGVLRCKRKFTVGVTDTNMLLSKKLWELIEPCSERINNVRSYLEDIDPSISYDVVPIQDPFGPTKDDPNFQMLVASAETIARARTVNDLRILNNVRTLELLTVPLISNGLSTDEEEDKISSSNIRMRLLGTRLKAPIPKTAYCPHQKPYVVGLTGGIASGKSSITKRFSQLGAGHIDCDLIAHEVYRPGTKLNTQLIETFGPDVVLENNEINRKALGAIVFNDKVQLEKLNSLVWPAIAEECIVRVKKLHEQGIRVIIIEAAVLLKAGWDRFCNEIWVCIIPPEEAIKRLIVRNKLTEEDARSRLSSQPSNSDYVKAANIVFSTFWSTNFTQKQVETAWEIIQSEVLIATESPQCGQCSSTDN